jgi:hypothetical protein
MASKTRDPRSRLCQSLRILAPALLAGTIACSHANHTVEPYRSDVDAGTALSTRAAQTCSSTRPALFVAPAQLFITDGCSMWPDGKHYVGCCVEHDIQYWCGGSKQQRMTADDEFGACVARGTSSANGTFMRLGVRLGGHPAFPVPYRWGYGHRYRGRHLPASMGNSEASQPNQ